MTTRRKRSGWLKAAFIANCQDIALGAYHVRINEERLEAFARSLQVPDGAAAYGWNEYLSDKALQDPVNVPKIFHELLMITAQNAGYLYKDAQSRTAKWEINGSGAKALVALFNSLRAKDIFKRPTGHFSAAQMKQLQAALSDKPLAEKRLECFQEIAPRRNWVDAILDGARTPQGYCFDMLAVEELAHYFPKSFGDDPFRKKAFLAFFMLAGHLESRGIACDLKELAVPADYRIPETLHAAGVLEFSDDLRARINRNELMVEDDPVVGEIRAASVLAVEDICRRSGLPLEKVDLALWQASRDGTLARLQKSNVTQKTAKRHFACRTLWF